MPDATGIHWTIPAKILLAGEYALLIGSPGIAATIGTSRQTQYDAHFRWADSSEAPGLWIGSNLFDSESSVATLRAAHELSMNHPVERFLAQALQCWDWEAVFEAFPGRRFELRLNSGFLPDLGFGSSSATLVSLARARRHAINLPQEQFESMLFRSLKAVQPRGSGYDIAVQWAALEAVPQVNELQTWDVLPGIQLPGISAHLSARMPPSFLIATGTYDATAESVAAFNPEHPAWRVFCSQQQELTRQLKTLLTAGESPQWRGWFRAAKQSSDELAIGLSTPLPKQVQSIMQRLDADGFVYKSLGAGRGDSLWVYGHPPKTATWIDQVVMHFAQGYPQ